MAIWSSGDMFLARHLLNSSNISLNAVNLSVCHHSCQLLALLKDIMAFMKTRRLKLILAETIGWPTSTLESHLNFRKFTKQAPCIWDTKKSKNLFFFNLSKVCVFIITTYFFRQLFDQCHNFLISVIQNRCNHIICKNVCRYVNGLFFVKHSLLWSRA